MIKTIELFAGVGGFRLGLEANNSKTKKKFKVIWSNQWEPSTKIQHASDIYVEKFRKIDPKLNHSCEDISKVDIKLIPNHDLLVGGFPCQDYSVARAPFKGTGIRGQKGVLWWKIYSILKAKSKNAPDYLMLENVDRLLKSPTSQRGRDFAIMLASLSDLGYIVEWRVINAADFGMPQRRKRVFIMAYKEESPPFKTITKLTNAEDWIRSTGTMQKAFPMKFDELFFNNWSISGDLVDISENNKRYNSKDRPFGNVGLMINREVFTTNAKADYKKPLGKLADVLIDEKNVPGEFFIPEDQYEEWEASKNSKKIPRKSKEGFEYLYSEGKMSFPDSIEKPSRTIVTGEGGKSVSRFKHVINVKLKSNLKKYKYRRLTPIELERLNGFPDNWTKGIPDSKRAFLMGNALVIGVIEKLAKSLYASSIKK